MCVCVHVGRGGGGAVCVHASALLSKQYKFLVFTSLEYFGQYLCEMKVCIQCKKNTYPNLEQKRKG